jgi:hypothetical protein
MEKEIVMVVTRPGNLSIQEGQRISVEFTEGGNIKLINEAIETHIFINLSLDEVERLYNQVAGYLENKGLLYT